MIDREPVQEPEDPFWQQALSWQQSLRQLIQQVCQLRGEMLASGRLPRRDALAEILFLLQWELSNHQRAYRKLTQDIAAAMPPSSCQSKRSA